MNPKLRLFTRERVAVMLAQFAIIVVGVLVALAANSAKERYREQEATMEALRSLKRDIGEDVVSLNEYWMPHLEETLEARTRLWTFLASLDPISNPLKFVQDIHKVTRYFTLNPNLAALHDLKNRSGLGLIKDMALRHAILKYLNEIENISDFDGIHRAFFVELAGRICPKIVGGHALPLAIKYLKTPPKGEEENLMRATAEKALDAGYIRSSDLLRELMVATTLPYHIKASRYKKLRTQAEDLIVLLEKATGPES